MDSDTPVTTWLAELRAGDSDAAQKLWQRYFERLVRLARQKLSGAPRRQADEEDVALSAFASFCHGVQQGRFPRLRDRHGLWPLLLAILDHKAVDAAQHDRRLKRGGGKVQGESVLRTPTAASSAGPGLDGLAAREPTPYFAARVAEECRRLLEKLGDPLLQQIATWKMEGFGSEDIAAKLGRSLPTVERKLRRIRLLWQSEVQS